MELSITQDKMPYKSGATLESMWVTFRIHWGHSLKSDIAWWHDILAWSFFFLHAVYFVIHMHYYVIPCIPCATWFLLYFAYLIVWSYYVMLIIYTMTHAYTPLILSPTSMSHTTILCGSIVLHELMFIFLFGFWPPWLSHPRSASLDCSILRGGTTPRSTFSEVGRSPVVNFS